MLQKILVAVNKSDISMQALDEAIALAKATNAQLKLIHVLDDRDPDQPEFPYPTEYQAYSAFNLEILDTYQKQYETFVATSWKWLEQQAQNAIDAGVPTEYEQPTGMAGKHICTYAQTWDADLIMIGSRCLKGLRELLLGSVSNYVVHHAQCSVCVIHPKDHRLHAPESTDNVVDSATKNSTPEALIV